MHAWLSPLAICFVDREQDKDVRFLVDKNVVWPFQGLSRQQDPIKVDVSKVEWEGVTGLPLICFQKEKSVQLDLFCYAVDSSTKEVLKSRWERLVLTASLVQEFANRIEFSWSGRRSRCLQTENSLLWRYMVLMEAIRVKDSEWLPDDEMFRLLFQFLAEIVAHKSCHLHSLSDAKKLFGLDMIQRDALVDIVAIVERLLCPEVEEEEASASQTGQRAKNAARYWVWLLDMLRDVAKDKQWKEVLRTVLLYACNKDIPVAEEYQPIVDAFQ